MTTVRLKSHVSLLGVLVAALAFGACDKASDSDKKDDGAIETNLVPVPCKEDKDCGGDIECGKDGFCDVDEMTVDGGADVSSGAPAPCNTDADCGANVKCVALSEDGPKFCDVEETVVSSGAAAPCNTDADCGTAQCVEREFGKFCDVDEMVVGP